MRQTQLESPAQIRSFQVPTPQAAPGWVVAKTLRTGICGTDVHSFFGETIFGKVFPFHIGHEICAQVTDAGSGVQNVAVGDTIVVNPFFTCGGCAACSLGFAQNCAHKTTIGLKGSGGFSEFICIPATSAYRVTSKNYAAMSLAEPLATVIYGFDKLRLNPTMSVLINGVGAIGMLFVQLMRQQAVRQLVVADFSSKKLEIAKELGADLALCPKIATQKQQLDTLRAKGFDVVIDCTGSVLSMQSTVNALAFGGQILLFGLCSAEAEMTIKPFHLYQKDASLSTSFALNQSAFCRAIALLENGAIRSDLIIDRVVPFADLEASIRHIAAGNASGKIVVDTTI